MTRLRRASVIATLILFASFAMASAECAWVLWSNDHMKQWVLRGTHKDISRLVFDRLRKNSPIIQPLIESAQTATCACRGL
jgi:hypothetical protein